MKKVILALVVVAAAVMVFLTTMSIINPVRFDREQQKREVVLQKQLKAIATLEQAYYDVYGTYASPRHLQWFMQEGKIYTVMAEGEYTDAMREQKMSEREAARLGLITRDTTWIPVKDSLLLGSGFSASNIFTYKDNKEAIKLEIGKVDEIIGIDTVSASVFQATIPFTEYLDGLDKVRLQQKISKAQERVDGYPGLRIGSLKEVKNTGNWE